VYKVDNSRVFLLAVKQMLDDDILSHATFVNSLFVLENLTTSERIVNLFKWHSYQFGNNRNVVHVFAFVSSKVEYWISHASILYFIMK